MEHILSQHVKYCQIKTIGIKLQSTAAHSSLSFRAQPHPAFNISSLLPEITAKGFALLPTLIKWFHTLNPSTRVEAWEAFKDNNVIQILRTHPKQQYRFFLNDLNGLDSSPNLGVNFERKAKKNHLTVLQATDAIGNCKKLPKSIRGYLKDTNAFVASVRDLLMEVLPVPTLPTILKARIFEYPASEPEAKARQAAVADAAMRAHSDGSVWTIIIAQSDGLLHFEHNGQWYSAVCSNTEPFAMLIPGLAAAHDYGISPTPHMVLGSKDRRVSITIALTPDFSDNREVAEQQLAGWQSSNLTERSEISVAE